MRSERLHILPEMFEDGSERFDAITCCMRRSISLCGVVIDVLESIVLRPTKRNVKDARKNRKPKAVLSKAEARRMGRGAYPMTVLAMTSVSSNACSRSHRQIWTNLICHTLSLNHQAENTDQPTCSNLSMVS